MLLLGILNRGVVPKFSLQRMQYFVEMLKILHEDFRVYIMKPMLHIYLKLAASYKDFLRKVNSLSYLEKYFYIV